MDASLNAGAPHLVSAASGSMSASAGLPSEPPRSPARTNNSAPGDSLYRFEALELKELSHRLDGVLWPRERTGCAKTGSPEFPVVLLEVQMHPDPARERADSKQPADPRQPP